MIIAGPTTKPATHAAATGMLRIIEKTAGTMIELYHVGFPVDFFLFGES